MKIILLNGPPGSGKDTLGNHLSWAIPGAVTYKFAEPVKKGVYVMYGLDPNLPLDEFEHCKNEPSQVFNYLSFRQACILYSEEQVKPFLGTHHFGQLLVKKLERENPEVAVVTDSGFLSEIEPVVHAFGMENVFLIRIHAEERGKTFEGDSRSYVYGPWGVDMYNNGAVDTFLSEATTFIEQEFLGYDPERNSTQNT